MKNFFARRQQSGAPSSQTSHTVNARYSKMQPIVLYDLKRNAAKEEDYAWSPNTWRARIVLNMKGLPYKTEWLNFTEVAPTNTKLGVSPNPEGSMLPQTVPTIYDPNTKKVVNESTQIAEYLDTQYPDDLGLFPPRSRATQRAFVDQNVKLMEVAFTAFVNVIFSQTQESDREYFRTSRQAWFGGATLEDVEPKGEQLDAILKGVQKWFDDRYGWIQAGGKGALFYGGETPLYADVDLMSYLQFIERVLDKEHPVYKLMVDANDGHWVKFKQAFSKWTERSA